MRQSFVRWCNGLMSLGFGERSFDTALAHTGMPCPQSPVMTHAIFEGVTAPGVIEIILYGLSEAGKRTWSLEISLACTSSSPTPGTSTRVPGLHDFVFKHLSIT
jgi:hypothetical protein